MGLAASSLDLIRKYTAREYENTLPRIPALSYTGMLQNQGAYGYGMDYLGNIGGVGLSDHLRVESDLVSRFIDYENMDESPLISSGYDIYADDSCQPDSITEKSLWVESDDEWIRNELDEDLFQKRLDVENNIWPQVRSLCKYGNDGNELVVRQGQGVISMNYMPAPAFRRIQVPGENHTLGYVYDPMGSFNITTNEFMDQLNRRINGEVDAGYNPRTHTAVMEDWEVVHMRLLGKTRNSVYGYGIAEPARWLYKRLVMLEDSILLHRLTRAPSRHAFYIDVSNIPPNETLAYLTKVKNSIKKKKFINQETGKIDMRYDIFSNDEDFYLPSRDGKDSTRVDTLAGPVYDHVEDVKFFENKLFAALKIPKPFLTYEESTAKTHLSAEDARFARTVMRIQREVKNGYKKVCDVHLAAKNIDPSKVNYKLKMTIPSAIFELAQLEIRAAEIELADKFEAWAPRQWIMNEVLGFSDDQISKMEEMRMREQEVAPVKKGKGGGGSGDLEKALSKRGKSGVPRVPERPSSAGELPAEAPPAPPVEAGVESRIRSERFLMDGIKRNTDSIKDKILEMRHADKSFDKRWGRIESLMQDLQHNMSTIRSKK